MKIRRVGTIMDIRIYAHRRNWCLLEMVLFFPDNADTAVTEHYLNGGFTVLLNDEIQWDIRVGRGLSGAADDYFVGTGCRCDSNSQPTAESSMPRSGSLSPDSD